MDLTTIVVLGVLVVVLIFVVTHLRPLNESEVIELATKRRGKEIQKYFDCYVGQIVVNPEFKTRMNATGKFYRISDSLFEFPSRVAGLLKYKKHEWVIIGFEKNKAIDLIWVNKGFDNSRASIYLPISRTKEIAKQGHHSSVLVFHNHPNPNPNRYDCTSPSDLDRATAREYASVLNASCINVVKFVCERGRPHRYFLSPAHSFFPVTDFRFVVNQLNGRSRFKNLRLHLERIF